MSWKAGNQCAPYLQIPHNWEITGPTHIKTVAEGRTLAMAIAMHMKKRQCILA